jgi:hypothetical protein
MVPESTVRYRMYRPSMKEHMQRMKEQFCHPCPLEWPRARRCPVLGWSVGLANTHRAYLPTPFLELALCQPQRFQKPRPCFREARDKVISLRTHRGWVPVPPFQKPNGSLSEFQAKNDSAKQKDGQEGCLSCCLPPGPHQLCPLILSFSVCLQVGGTGL